MTLCAVAGAAGCGKAVWLIGALGEALADPPLREGQRVLALTFMRGARQRLHDKLRGFADVRGRLHCVTIDSFAQRLVGRRRCFLQRDHPCSPPVHGGSAKRGNVGCGAIHRVELSRCTAYNAEQTAIVSVTET
jgi:hypothetical protein